MATTRNRIVRAALFGAVLAGCSSTPRYDDHMGEAVRANLSAQVLDPAASSNVNPAKGVDGAVALATQDRYQRSFKESDPSADRSLVGSGSR